MTNSTLLLTDMQREVLKEVGNIGAGHAATALADIMNLAVGLTEPHVSMIPIDPKQMREDFGHADVAALHMDIKSAAAPGEIVILFDRAESVAFVRRFLSQQIGEIDLEAGLIDASLQEIANIIGGSYLTALVGLIGAEMLPSIPDLTYGHLDDVLARFVMGSQTSEVKREAFMISNGFINERGAINVRFLLIPKDGVLGPYLHAFGIEG